MLASNFAGSTSALLSLDGGRLAGRLKADALFPVAGYKRCLDTQNGYGRGLWARASAHCMRRALRLSQSQPHQPHGCSMTVCPWTCPAEFRYPARWLSDQRLYQRYAERVERSNGLDPPSLNRSAHNSPTPWIPKERRKKLLYHPKASHECYAESGTVVYMTHARLIWRACAQAAAAAEHGGAHRSIWAAGQLRGGEPERGGRAHRARSAPEPILAPVTPLLESHHQLQTRWHGPLSPLLTACAEFFTTLGVKRANGAVGFQPVHHELQTRRHGPAVHCWLPVLSATPYRLLPHRARGVWGFIGFQLESLGGARQAGERFLSTTVAPEGSGREAQLLAATERCASLRSPIASRALHAHQCCPCLHALSS